MIIADSSVLIEHLRGRKSVTRFLTSQPDVVVPAIAAWEMWKSASTVASQAAVRDLLAVFAVEPFGAAQAETGGALQRQAEVSGRRRPVIDLLIAAHAMHHGAPVATLDRDYDGIPNLKVVRVTA